MGDRAARTIKLIQKRLTAQLVENSGLEDCRIKSVPLSTSLQLTESDGELLDKDTYTHTHLIGSLLYLSFCTRLDIAQAVGALSKYMAEPTVVHLQAAKGLLRYVATIREQGIMYGRIQGTVMRFPDADYAGDLDHKKVHDWVRPCLTWRSHHLAQQATANRGCVLYRSTTHCCSTSGQGGSVAACSAELGITSTRSRLWETIRALSSCSRIRCRP